MPRKRFGAEQIIPKLREAEVDLAKGLTVAQVPAHGDGLIFGDVPLTVVSGGRPLPNFPNKLQEEFMRLLPTVRWHCRGLSNNSRCGEFREEFRLSFDVDLCQPPEFIVRREATIIFRAPRTALRARQRFIRMTTREIFFRTFLPIFLM